MLSPSSYRSIPGFEFEQLEPIKARKPMLLFWNEELAAEFSIPPQWQNDTARLAALFSGNTRIDAQISPLALAYAGHQFGGLSPQLGDGRAHLLGEFRNQSGEAWDVQLKGSGPTQYSRNGDGRCGLGPALREYIMGEALYALGVPTSRSLAVVATGETIWREGAVAGAVVTRLARSHIRVGTFEYYAIRGKQDVVRALADYTIERHYPQLANLPAPQKYVSLLEAAMERQIKLVVEWMRIGFIHGVMNTDNTLLSGDTLDYGPCAMMGIYDPQTVYSSIDRQGRYAFGNQPHVAQWNMARFAETLLPLIDETPKQAIPLVEPIINSFREHFEQHFYVMMAGKLGLELPLSLDGKPDQKAVRQLIDDLLQIMEQEHLDYTITFAKLNQSLTQDSNAEPSAWSADMTSWLQHWRQIIDQQAGGVSSAREKMQHNNPLVIPRNHHVEAALEACEAGDLTVADKLIRVLRQPYEQTPALAMYQDAPEDGDRDYHTFCGT